MSPQVKALMELTQWVSPNDVARIANLSSLRVRQLIDEGKLRAERCPTRLHRWRIRVQDARAFIEQRERDIAHLLAK